MNQHPFNRAPFTTLLQVFATRVANELEASDVLPATVEQDRRKKLGTSVKLVADFDKDFLASGLARIAALRLEGEGAIDDAIRLFDTFGKLLVDYGKSPDKVTVDCTVMVETYRAAYEKILLFNIRSAQILCTMEEIRNSTRLLYECAPDSCMPPPFSGQPQPQHAPTETWRGEIPPAATAPTPGAPVEQPPTKPGGESPTLEQPPFDTINWMPPRFQENISRIDLRAVQQADKMGELEAELHRLREQLHDLTQNTEVRLSALQAAEQPGDPNKTSSG